MEKKMKQLLGMMMIILSCLAFQSCGGDDDNGIDPETPSLPTPPNITIADLAGKWYLHEAPLLLGNVVLDEVKSVEVDNNKKTIKFKR